MTELPLIGEAPADASGARLAGARIGVVTFPGTLDDRDAARAVRLAGGTAVELWHADTELGDVDAVVIPGGFSYGDYLRAGAIARFAPLMTKIIDAANSDAKLPVLGICNGFQALLRLGLLTGGGLAPNDSGHFECRWIWMRRPDNARSPLLDGIDRIAMPIGHGEGRFVAKDAASLVGLEARGEVGLVYCDAVGNPGGYPVNPNGSDAAVAALTNAAGNVLGLMPHPERNVSIGQAPAGRADGMGLTVFTNALRMARG